MKVGELGFFFLFRFSLSFLVLQFVKLFEVGFFESQYKVRENSEGGPHLDHHRET